MRTKNICFGVENNCLWMRTHVIFNSLKETNTVGNAVPDNFEKALEFFSSLQPPPPVPSSIPLLFHLPTHTPPLPVKQEKLKMFDPTVYMFFYFQRDHPSLVADTS